MKRFLKWLGIIAAGLVVLLLLALAVLFLASQRVINKTYALPPPTSVAVPTDSASIAEGKRLATLRGCFNGCHGERSEGHLFAELPDRTRLPAPNLTRIVREYSEAELERAIRHGLREDGRSLLGMPSEMFYLLTDRDLGAIIAFLKSQPQEPNDLPSRRLGPLVRFFLLRGRFLFAAELVERDGPRLVGSRDKTEARGEYLAKTLCSECHGVDLRGGWQQPTPDLAIAATYSQGDFARLMRTGVARGERDLGLMSDVARGRFAHLTDAELTDLHTYLTTLASRGGSAP